MDRDGTVEIGLTSPILGIRLANGVDGSNLGVTGGKSYRKKQHRDRFLAMDSVNIFPLLFTIVPHGTETVLLQLKASNFILLHKT